MTGAEQLVSLERVPQLIVTEAQRVGGSALVEAMLGQRLTEQLSFKTRHTRFEVRRPFLIRRDRIVITFFWTVFRGQVRRSNIGRRLPGRLERIETSGRVQASRTTPLPAGGA